MVAPLHILVTGAGGFLGGAVTAEAAARGHQVRAVARRRPLTDMPSNVEPIAADLAAVQPLSLLRGVDAVIHCAGRLSGTDDDHQRDTVAPARRLAEAAAAMDAPPRFVLVSSMSVYGYADLAPGASVTEALHMEPAPDRRDAYTRAKLAQEAAVAQTGIGGWTARPGAIYGPERLQNGHVGVSLGPIFIRIGNDGEIPLIHVESCARALVTMAETAPPEPGAAVNLVDDALPSRSAFSSALGPAAPRPSARVSYAALARIAGLLGGPGLLRPETLAARMKPLTYSNARARELLDWTPEANHISRIGEASR